MDPFRPLGCQMSKNYWNDRDGLILALAVLKGDYSARLALKDYLLDKGATEGSANEQVDELSEVQGGSFLIAWVRYLLRKYHGVDSS